MLTRYTQAYIGSPRPHLSPLSATRTNLVYPVGSVWSLLYSTIKFPPVGPSFKAYWITRPQLIGA